VKVREEQHREKYLHEDLCSSSSSSMALLIPNTFGRMTGFGLARVGTTILSQDDHKALFSSPFLFDPPLKILQPLI